MEKYYLLSWKEGKVPFNSAYAPKGTPLAHELIQKLQNLNKLPFKFEMVNLIVGNEGVSAMENQSNFKNICLDYQPNSLAFPLMSEKLKTVIEANLIGNEQIDWISCVLTCGSEDYTYYILRFNHMFDVLDMEKTMFVPKTDQIIKPVFSKSKINKYSIFPKPSSYDLWKISPSIYVSENIKKAIEKAKLKGLDFEKVKVS